MYSGFRAWARSEERRGVEIPAIAYRANGKRLGVLLSDLSYDGCQVTAPDELRENEQITIVIFDLGAEIPATVRWAKEGKLGVRFGEMVSAARA